YFEFHDCRPIAKLGSSTDTCLNASQTRMHSLGRRDNLPYCMSTDVIHADAEKRGNSRCNIKIGNAINLNALGNSGTSGDENGLHLGIGVDVTMRARIGDVSNKFAIGLATEHVIRFCGKYKVRRLVATARERETNLRKLISTVDFLYTFNIGKDAAQFGKQFCSTLRIGDVNPRDTALRHDPRVPAQMLRRTRQQPFFFEQHIRTNLISVGTKSVVRDDDQSRILGASAAVDYVHDLLDLSVEKRHRGKTGGAHRSVGVIDVIKRQQMKQQKVRLVFLQDVNSSGSPDFVLPGLTAVFECFQLFCGGGSRVD